MRTEIRRVELPRFIVRECVYPAGLRLARHAHDYSNVTIVVGGDIDESADCGEHRGRAFSVVYKPAGSDHENRVGRDGARTLSIQLRHAAEGTWSWFEEPEVVRAAVALLRAWRAAADLESSASVLLAEVLVGRASSRLTVPPWLDEITRTLDARFDEPLRFEA